MASKKTPEPAEPAEADLKAAIAIEEHVREFETAKDVFEQLQNRPIDGTLDERIKKRTDLAMAEVRYRRASNSLQETVRNASSA